MSYVRKHLQLVAYLALVVALIVAFTRIETIRHERARALAVQTAANFSARVQLTNQLCQQSEISREALRKEITATASLARSLVPAQNPELVANVIAFQNEQLALLPPIKCDSNAATTTTAPK